MEKLAIDGGNPVSEKEIPIAKPLFIEETVQDIIEVWTPDTRPKNSGVREKIQ
ncbi:hypothetical protein KEJ33_05420 [Candidatus Bathyarchaeota archaeon]|nr:hypothetical protein [Candidatus Bathyarchaeota archaeon]